MSIENRALKTTCAVGRFFYLNWTYDIVSTEMVVAGYYSLPHIPVGYEQVLNQKSSIKNPQLVTPYDYRFP